MKFQINPSPKIHLLIAALISIWLVLFLILIAPFDVSDLTLDERLVMMPMYGVISFLSYIILIPGQNWVLQNKERWNGSYETTFILIFNLLVGAGSFVYYKTDLINGSFGLKTFIFEVYYPIFFVLLSILIVLRWFLFKAKSLAAIVENVPERKKIILNGDNKLDTLQIFWEDLVSVSSADNYVEVSYLNNNLLQKKLLRSTLKKIEQQHPNLLKVHRSHLINPAHFVEWKDNSTIIVHQIAIPVSKTYQASLLSLKSRP